MINISFPVGLILVSGLSCYAKAHASGMESKAVAVSDNPQLFLDDYLIARMKNLTRQIHQPRKHSRPVIVQDQPWEKRMIALCGTVLYEPESNKFRCWYLASESPSEIPDTPEAPGMAEYFVCYAESKDGLHWTKPLVGPNRLGPYRKHNIVIPNGHGFCVLKTPWDPDPERRYKLAGGNIFATSPDGIHWKVKSWKEAVGKNDTGTSLVWWNGEYLAFVRTQEKDDRPKLNLQRAVGISVSKDFEQWTRKKTIFMTDREDGYPWVQPYGLEVTAYGDQLIGLLPVLHLEHKEGNNSLGDMDIQLVVSRDGRNWHRVADRAVFIPQEKTGPAGKRVWNMRVFPGSTMLVKDDLIYIYYTGTPTRHGEKIEKKSEDTDYEMAIGLATLPAERFVALQPFSSAGGVLETKRLKFSGGYLLVNAEIQIKDLEVELLNDRGKVISGFERTRSRLIPRDKFRYQVVWTRDGGQSPRSDIRGDQPRALRFFLRKGSLYAVQITRTR